MSKQALRIIRENIEKHERGEDASILDLTNCALKEIPEEAYQCIWVKILDISAESIIWYENEENNNPKISTHNKINRIKSEISDFQHLQMLNLGGLPIIDLMALKGLPYLICVNIEHTLVSDLTPLFFLIMKGAAVITNTGYFIKVFEKNNITTQLFDIEIGGVPKIFAGNTKL